MLSPKHAPVGPMYVSATRCSLKRYTPAKQLGFMPFSRTASVRRADDPFNFLAFIGAGCSCLGRLDHWWPLVCSGGPRMVHRSVVVGKKHNAGGTREIGTLRAVPGSGR